MVSSKHVALLRGINVGGNNPLAMKDLAKLFEKAGCTEVSTYVASGNVIFRAPASVLKTLPSAISGAIEKHSKLRVPLVLRSADEMQAVVDNNPFAGEPEARLYVFFLADAPKPAAIAKLDPNLSAPDRFIVQGREIYLVLPNGAARTKLGTTLFDRAFNTLSTGRNWRTTQKLAELTQRAMAATSREA